MLNSTNKIALIGLAIVCVGLSVSIRSGVRRPVPAAAAPAPSASPTASPSPSPSPTPDFQLNQVVVQLKPGDSIADVNNRNSTTTIGSISGTSYYVVSPTTAASSSEAQTPNLAPMAAATPAATPTAAATTEQLRSQLAADPAVQNAELNYLLAPDGAIISFPGGHVVPGKSQSDYEAQRQLLGQLLGLTDAQLRSLGAGKTVAVIDTGVDRTHPALASHLWTDDRVNKDIPGDYIDNDNDGLLDDAYGWDF